MKREIWLGVLVLILLSGICGYFARIAPRLGDSPDDLAWLRSNFKVSPQQMQKIEQLHHDYMPRCMEMCSRVRQANLAVQVVVANGNASNADIETAVSQAEKVKSECRVAMIRHVHEIAAAMPAEEGARYLKEIAPLLSDSAAHERAMAGHASNP